MAVSLVAQGALTAPLSDNDNAGGGRAFHEVAAIFPLLEGVAFDELVADIRNHGLREPILLHPNGSIIDGRNRYRACFRAGVAPTFRTWAGPNSTDALVALVLSSNLHRRHLSESQRGMAAAKASEILKEEARKRQATSGPGMCGAKPLRANLPEAVCAEKASTDGVVLPVEVRSSVGRWREQAAVDTGRRWYGWPAEPQ